MELSKASLEKAKKFLNDYNQAYEQGVENAIEKATELLYEKVKQYCYDEGIEQHTNNVYMEYDAITKTGRVWTNDMVLIFNEIGTGIVGSQNPHPSPQSAFKSWKYDVNKHGEKGWYYPKEDGSFGWTKGLPSRHMFFNAFEDIKSEIGETIEVEIRKAIGDLY